MSLFFSKVPRWQDIGGECLQNDFPARSWTQLTASAQSALFPWKSTAGSTQQRRQTNAESSIAFGEGQCACIIKRRQACYAYEKLLHESHLNIVLVLLRLGQVSSFQLACTIYCREHPPENCPEGVEPTAFQPGISAHVDKAFLKPVSHILAVWCPANSLNHHKLSWRMSSDTQKTIINTTMVFLNCLISLNLDQYTICILTMPSIFGEYRERKAHESEY